MNKENGISKGDEEEGYDLDGFAREDREMRMGLEEARASAAWLLGPDNGLVSFTGGPSVTIKSHHNVGGLPARMNMKLVEPLRELFKDEVRELGLPADLVNRHPFPGPGLAIRIPGNITRDKLDLLRQVDAVYLDEIRKAGLYDEIWQAVAVSLRAKVTSTNGMTADYYPFDHAFVGRVANASSTRCGGSTG